MEKPTFHPQSPLVLAGSPSSPGSLALSASRRAGLGVGEPAEEGGSECTSPKSSSSMFNYFTIYDIFSILYHIYIYVFFCF